MKKNILLVDGMALLFRGYYATAYSKNFMYNDKGIATNGVYQFLRYFLNATELFKPSHVICCWDMGSKTFRTELYEDYKSNREKPPEELIPQFDLVKEVVDLFNIPNLGIVNYEADDIIGTLTKQFPQDNITILTGDQDMLQLVQPNVEVALMKKGIGNYDVINIENFYEKRGLSPEQIVDFKGFTGDSADNYPGVRGIGEKTALKLLQQYETIENILDEQTELSKSIQKRLNDGLDMFYLSKTLAEIKCDLPLTVDLESAQLIYDKLDIQTKLLAIGLRQLAELK